MRIRWTLILSAFFMTISATHAEPSLIKEDTSYSYRMTYIANQGGPQHTRSYFSYFTPFFWGTDDLAMGYAVSNNQFDFEIKKWDWLDYRLSLGFKYTSLSQLNRAAQLSNGYQLNDGPLDGSYNGLALFSEYLLDDTTKLTGSYENRMQVFAANSNTPRTFTLPQDNTLHLFTARLEALPQTKSDYHTRYQSLELTYAFSDRNRPFGANQEFAQFDRGIYFVGKHYDTVDLGRSQIVLGETILAGRGDFFPLGTPTLWKNNFQPVILGFSENSLLASFAMMGQFNLMNVVRTHFYHIPVGVHWYNSLALYDNRLNSLGINQLAFGTGVGLEIPFTLPILGEYLFQSTYLLGFPASSSQIRLQLSSNFSM